MPGIRRWGVGRSHHARCPHLVLVLIALNIIFLFVILFVERDDPLGLL